MIGLAFLNFIGTILFIGFFFVALKAIFGRMYYANAGSYGSWSYEGQRHHHKSPQKDSPLGVARERLANSELAPKDFEAIKSSLNNSEPDPADSYRRNDSAFNIARMRLAKGELTPKEFEAVRQALS